MTYAEKNIIKTYSLLFDRLSAIGKMELLEKLSKSLKRNTTTKEKDFFKSFGAFESDKSAAELAKEIKASRKFRKKDLSLD